MAKTDGEKLARAYRIASYLYAVFLRDLIIEAIEDPESSWDDLVLDILDRVFMEVKKSG
jgi:hypothetical protein